MLFRWELPLFDDPIVSAVSWAIVAGMVLSLLYGYLINGATRQGPHDLLVGSYVVVWPPVKEGPLPKTPKAHLVFTIGLFVLGFLLLGAGSLAYTQLETTYRGETLEGFERLETALEQDERILVATVSESPAGFLREERPSDNTLTIDVWTNYCVRYSRDCEDMDLVIAKMAFQELPSICGYSNLVIKTIKGFDIGIAVPAWSESELTRPVTVWQQELQDIGRCL